MLPILNFFLAVTLWVQVPQWSDDWSNCAVDVPDSSCHWYIVNADNIPVPELCRYLLGKDLTGRQHHGIV